MFGFKKTKVELDKETLINTVDGDKTIEELINEYEEAKAEIEQKNSELASKDETITRLETELAEATKEPVVEPAKDTVVVDAAVAKEETDEGLKQELNNALAAEVKTVIVKVPEISIN